MFPKVRARIFEPSSRRRNLGKELGLGCRQFMVCDAKRGSISCTANLAAVPLQNILPSVAAEHAHANPRALNPLTEEKKRFW